MKEDKLNYLDGIRGLAALVVVFGHFILAFYPAFFSGSPTESHISRYYDARLADTPINVFFNGQFAVAIFFVLSGFVLTSKYFNYKKSEIIISSAVRRYFRLVVPVTFSCFIAYVVLKLNLFYNDELVVFTKSNEYLPNYYNFRPSIFLLIKEAFVDLFLYGRSTNPYNAVLWTMKTEFIGSFLVFSFALMFGKLKNRYIFYIITLVIFFKTYYTAFILGMVFSDLFYNKSLVYEYFKNRFARSIFLMLGILLGAYPNSVDINNSIYKYITFEFLGRDNVELISHILGAAIVVFVILGSKSLQRFFELKVFQFLGKISFSMYVMHFIILFSLSSYLFVKLAGHLPYHVNFIVTFSFSVGFILSVSTLVAKYVDQKGIKFSRFIYAKCFKDED